MEKQGLLEKVQDGDYVTVGKVLGISANYARKLVFREGAKFHNLALNTLLEVIESREAIINKSRITSEV